MSHHDHSMSACIDACMACHRTCLEEAMQHCLEMGGPHVAPPHFRLMIACAEICRASAAVMMTGSPVHVHVCRACAEICTACADDCARLGGMGDCVAACRRCAEECRRMAGAAAA